MAAYASLLPGPLVMPGPDRASLSYRASSSVIPSEASVSPASCDTLGLRPQYDSPSTATFWPDIAPLAGPLPSPGRKAEPSWAL